MLSLNQILNEMKNKKSYFTKAYPINMVDVNLKEIEWGIKFTYRDKKFLLVKQIGKPNGYILKGNYVIAKIDLRYPENIFTYMVLKECDNSLERYLPNKFPLIFLSKLLIPMSTFLNYLFAKYLQNLEEIK